MLRFLSRLSFSSTFSKTTFSGKRFPVIFLDFKIQKKLKAKRENWIFWWNIFWYFPISPKFWRNLSVLEVQRYFLHWKIKFIRSVPFSLANNSLQMFPVPPPWCGFNWSSTRISNNDFEGRDGLVRKNGDIKWQCLIADEFWSGSRGFEPRWGADSIKHLILHSLVRQSNRPERI